MRRAIGSHGMPAAWSSRARSRNAWRIGPRGLAGWPGCSGCGTRGRASPTPGARARPVACGARPGTHGRRAMDDPGVIADLPLWLLLGAAGLGMILGAAGWWAWESRREAPETARALSDAPPAPIPLAATAKRPAVFWPSSGRHGPWRAR